ncbi:fasciclin-like arabinogalactan protein 8 [Dorcoceras hygrometricum]|uniref:Fasciclin-like arabinogalactan protein 8 n=1 Tax=Dorcoceras hygrometricum TaxID=472368 RepID=A0A2Z7D6D4_9LAMI|nr:fasciclin-like arabinogalactan protein 8 [Dorcoceras hygrometricum]
METPQRGGRNKSDEGAAAAALGGGRRRREAWRGGAAESRSRDVWIQLAVGPQPLRLRNHNFGLTHRIMVKLLATSPHDPLGITDSACKNQLVVVSVQYGPFNTYIPIRSTTIGKSRVARDPITMHTSWRSDSDIASVTRSYSDQQEESADEKRCASFGMSCDDISLDVITISSWLSADEAKRKRRCDVSVTQLRLFVHLWSLGVLTAADCGIGSVHAVSTGCVLGKWVYLVTLAMSLFDLQDVCIVIGSLATLDLPMVVDLIGIYVLKGPYCTLTTTNWFLQALSVIPRGSWGDGNTQFLRDRSTENSSWELRTPPALPYSLTQQKALNKLKGRNFTYPKKLGAKSDAYANRLHKGDVFAHLTSFKQTSESNIQTKRLSKKSPTLPLSLSSELSTIGNQRR